MAYLLPLIATGIARILIPTKRPMTDDAEPYAAGETGGPEFVQGGQGGSFRERVGSALWSLF